MAADDRRSERKVRRAVLKSRVKEFFSYIFWFTFLFLVFIASLFYISQKAHIHEMNQKTIELEKELADLDAKISEVNVAISSQFSLEHIYKCASEELGMIYPTEARVVVLRGDRYFTLDDESDPATVTAHDDDTLILNRINRAK